MPTYEDIFFLKLLWEERLVSHQEIESSLRNFYQAGCRGETISLAEVLEKLNLVPRDDIARLWNKALATIEQLQPDDMVVPSRILAKSCQRQKILGKSSLGTTYQAIHPQIGNCALKCLEGAIARNKKFLQPFLLQIEKGKRIVHPNWAKIYAVDHTEMIIIREAIIGESLEERLSRTAITLDEACWITLEAGLALEASARQGILHKNLKPANLIISNKNQVKVVDFSLPPTVPHYLAPEQCARKKSDVRSDIYSLGIIFYRMLTGTVPFDGRTAQEVMQKHRSQDYPPISCPPSILRIVDRMLFKDPEKRYQKYSELLDDLQAILEQEVATGKVRIPVPEAEEVKPQIKFPTIPPQARKPQKPPEEDASLSKIPTRKSRTVAMEAIEVHDWEESLDGHEPEDAQAAEPLTSHEEEDFAQDFQTETSHAQKAAEKEKEDSEKPTRKTKPVLTPYFARYQEPSQGRAPVEQEQKQTKQEPVEGTKQNQAEEVRQEPAE